MRIVDWRDLEKTPLVGPSALTCGVFDGVHRGHRALIQRVTARGLQSVVVTFRVPPARLLRPDALLREITTLDEKSALLAGLGVDTLILVDFSPAFRACEGAAFIQELVRRTTARALVIGEDFKCGHDGAFRAAAIASLCAELGVEVEIVPPVLDEGRPVSSSRIRAALNAGERDTAERLLGRH